MGLSFAAMLLMGKPDVVVPGIDVNGFVKQLDEVLDDARGAIDRTTAIGKRRARAGGIERADALSDDSRARLAHHAATARDLAAKLGKEVDVEVSCGDWLVPPHVADVIDTTLLHLLRNAIDHAIETRAERTSA